MAFCIPKHLVQKLKESALKGELDIKKLYQMSPKERRDFFTKHTDVELGKMLNAEFEKAMVSKQKTAITDWVKSVFTPQERLKPAYKTMLDKVNSLQEMGVLNPKSEKAFLEDLVSDRLGVSVTVEEVRAIETKAKRIQEAQKALGNEIGNPEKADENVAFFKAKREMDDYLQGLVPAHRLKVLTGTIGRGMMLASVKSPLLNIISNTELAITEAFTRRLSSGSVKGADNKLAIDFIKMANRIYQASGYDISRMTSLKDTGVSGERVLGETVHAQGKGLIRAIGRVFEDIIFKQLLGAPDAAFASAHFADSVNLQSMKMAKGNKELASKYMRDAMKLNPETPEGELLRSQGILDAQVATWTNISWAAKFSETVRKALNTITGDLRFGDFAMPFVRTPSNVVETGLDYAGVGFLKSTYKVVKGIRTGTLHEPEVIQSAVRDAVRSGMGMTLAVIVASLLGEDDFVGAYDPQRAQIETLRNSNVSSGNAVRIGGKWVSSDLFGALNIPLSAIMYARKYGTNPKETVVQFGVGLKEGVKELPGIEAASDYLATSRPKKWSWDELLSSMGNYATTELASRLMPSIISDAAKATDQYERVTGKGLEGVKAKIPGLRQTLPIKQNIFGEQLRGESALSDVLFGSRVKTDKEDTLVKELNRVSEAVDKGINFTDWDKSSSVTLRQFREKVGDETYQEAKTAYGQKLKDMLQSAMEKPTYDALPDEDKLVVINGTDAKAMNEVFKEYKFKYKKAKAKKTSL